MWDLNTGKLLSTLGGHTGGVYGGAYGGVKSVAISPDSTKVVSGSGGYDNTIKVWDLNTGKLLSTLKGHNDHIYSVAISPDNTKIVSGSYDNTIKVWDLNTGKLLRYFRA